MAGPQKHMVAGPDAVIVRLFGFMGMSMIVPMVMVVIMAMMVMTVMIVAMVIGMTVAMTVIVLGVIVRHNKQLSVLSA